MNCTEVKDLLSDYYDAELAPDARERVAAHLDNCPECSAELARFGQLTEMMPQSSLTVPSQLGWQQFQKQMVGETPVEVAERITSSKRLSRRSWVSYRGLRPVMAVAALLLVAVGWFEIGRAHV